MNINFLRKRGLCATMAGVAVLWMTGCGGGTDTAADNSLEFYITPTAATLAAATLGTGFQAVGGALPITWTVSDPSLGTISASADTTSAVYTRAYTVSTNGTVVTAMKGANDIQATDSRGWSAHAVVVQN